MHGFHTFALSGNEFSIPCKFSEFEKAGFTISNDEDKKIKPGESNGYAYYEEDGTYRGTIFIFVCSNGLKTVDLILTHRWLIITVCVIRILCRKRESLEDLH